VSPVRYELGFYIPEDGILHSQSRKTPNLTTLSIFNSVLKGIIPSQNDRVGGPPSRTCSSGRSANTTPPFAIFQK
jgi:hypothetical protein